MTTWLLLEDEADVKQMMLATIDLLGATGLDFPDGETMIDWIEAAEAGKYDGDMPELALLDLRMPTATGGAEVAARLRRSPMFSELVIVLITAYRFAPNEQQDVMLQSGADFLLYKPLPDIDELGYIFHGLLLRR